MEHLFSLQKQDICGENSANHFKFVKQEPLEINTKNEPLHYQETFNENEFLPSASISLWAMLVKRCRFLFQEDYGHTQMNSHFLTEILIREANELLQDIAKFFQDCCKPIVQEENHSEGTLIVNGLLVNCLPSGPKNSICYYIVSTDIPQVYLETLFSPLSNEIEDIDFDHNGFMPLAPNVEIDVKLENGDIDKRKISKPVKKPKVEKEKKVKKQKSSNTLFCDICGQGVPSPSALRIHIGAVHEKKKPWKCNKCGEKYKYKNGLVHHKKDKCPGVPKKERKLIYWGVNVNNPKCLHPNCVDKDEKYTVAGIYKHVIDEHSPDPDDSMNVQCPNCPMRFPMTSVLKYHQEKAHQSKDIICNICGKAVKAYRMKAHISKIHTLDVEKKLQCDKCDYRTNVKRDLNRHMYTHSDNPDEGKTRKCEICYKMFSTGQKLREHLLTHGKIRPYQCKLCSGTFTNFSGHRLHMMNTHGVKFTCDICGKDSSSIKGLGIHKRDKHGIPM